MNKKIKQPAKRILAVLLSLICTLSMPLCVFSEEAPTPSPENDSASGTVHSEEISHLAENAVHLDSVQDLIQFSLDCSSDVWSQEKVFILDGDIDLSGTDFSPIPTFGGIFLGQGHTIKGLSLKGGSNNIGLFRYVQKSGEIYQLSVSGNAEAKESHLGLAFLAGCNHGLISSCTASGNVTGGNNVGGIAGLNEVTGIITDCQSNGTVNGRHLAGGIVGENKGTIMGCANHSFVNTTPDDNKIDLSSLDILGVDASLTDLLTTENAASVTDIGGISGKNSGIIRASVNEGSVGYPHVGYNIGGISGSQTGYIEGCVNHGSLNGRKDIGGIAGQMEPSSELEFSEDMLTRLDAEFDKLHGLLTRLDNDAKDSSEALTGQVDVLLTSVENVQHSIDEIITNAGNHLEDFAGLTDLAVLPSPEPVSLDFLDDLEKPSLPSFSPWPFPSDFLLPTVSPTPTVTPVPTTAPAPTVTPVPTTAPAPITSPAATTSPDGNNTGRNNADEAETDTADGISTGSFTADTYQAQPMENNPVKELENENSKINADSEYNPFSAGFANDFSTYASYADSLRANISREKIEDDINEVQENIYDDASHVLEKLQDIVQNQASVLSARVYAAQNSLSGSVLTVISDTRSLNSLLDDENQILLDDIQAIIDEIHVISNIITEPETIDPDEVLADVSDEDSLSDTTGKVMDCINNGSINGDINVGGIAGTMSRENNLDPENDLNLDSATLNFRYKERIVVRQCQNTGTVNGKKDRIGGVAGEMALGSIIDCTNTGTVISDDGDMIGGIAGYSASTVRSSSAKCCLSGKNQIGGITGYGKVISDCYSMIEILDGESFLGSVSGKTDSLESVSNNYFVEDHPAGIDGVSYQGAAEALSYEDFTAREDLPEIFRQIFLTFLSDDKIVSTATVNYGDTLAPGQLPEVPPKEGYVGRWEDFNSSSVTFDQEIRAVYTEYITTLESRQTKGERPILLLEGRFSPEDTLTLLSIDAYPSEAQTKAECWKITLSGSSQGPYVIRYLIPTDMESPSLELYENNTWQSVDTIIDGSYYVFTSERGDIVFSCVDRPKTTNTGTIIITGACALLLAVIIASVLHKKKRRADGSRHKKSGETTS